ncbi:MAG: AAA family ATPase, partial [Saprospiraceae bacterium]|nr:AAA family ATPase [Saprospiraceae bacterium]
MSSEALSELEQVLALLKLEKEEDFEQHRRFVQGLPLAERVSKGYCWYPLAVIRTGYSVGDRAFVVVEKSDKIKEHQFRAGKTVSLFTQQAGAKRPEISGVIHFVDKNKMHIILNAEYVPDWATLGQVGVDLLFDERSYVEMERALRLVMSAKNDRLAELREVILGKSAARFREINTPLEIPALNDSQREAVREILASQDIALIHGPPGTGKTTTLVQAVKLLCKTESTV